MSKQVINNTNITPDTLFAQANKINDNFTEVYDALSATSLTKTSELTNDGADAINPFITALNIPTSYTISAIDGLSTALATLSTNISTISGVSSSNLVTIGLIQGDITTILNTLSGFNSIINAQNGQIATIQGDIVAIYNIINP